MVPTEPERIPVAQPLVEPQGRPGLYMIFFRGVCTFLPLFLLQEKKVEPQGQRKQHEALQVEVLVTQQQS